MRPAALALLAALAVAAAATAGPPRNESRNWSGYAATGARFTTANASWVQPAADCEGGTRGETASAFWVGLGGELRSSSKIEQLGTDSDCDANGRPYYFAWYEIWPRNSVPVSLRIRPGDSITANVEFAGTFVQFTLKNETTGQSFAKGVTVAHPDGSSAEWIVEVPSNSTGGHDQLLSLTRYGSVRFTHAWAADASGIPGPISDPRWKSSVIDFASDRGDPRNQAQTFINGVYAAHSRPTPLTSNGSVFGVTWQPGHSSKKSKVPSLAA